MKRFLFTMTLLIAFCVTWTFGQTPGSCDAVLPTSLGTVSFETAEGFTSGSSLSNTNALDGQNCWHAGHAGSAANTSYVPYIYSSTAHTGSACLRMYAYRKSTTDGDGNYAVFPQFDVSTRGVNGYQVTFWARKTSSSSSYNDTLWVGVMTDPTDISTFTYVDYALVTSTTYQEFTIYLNSYAGNGSYFAFRSNVDPNSTASTKYGSFYVDDVTFAVLPTCFPVTGVTASDITTASANISWTASGHGESMYQYVVALKDATPDWNNASLPFSGTTCTVTDLNAATDYDVYIRSYCDEEDQSEGVKVTLRTECEGVLPTTLGTIGFEESEGFTTGSGNLDGENCWHAKSLQATSASYIPYVNGSSARTGSNCLKLYAYSSGSDGAFAIFPPLDVSTTGINQYQISFWARKSSTGASYNTDTIWVGVMTDPDDLSTFTYVGYGLASTSDYVESVVYLNSYQGTGTYLAFRANVNPTLTTTRYAGFYVDDVTISPMPTCFRPTDLNVSNITAVSADINWTASGHGETMYQYVVALKDSTPDWNNVSLPFTGTSCTPTDLNSNTDYDIYIRSYCEEDEQSDGVLISFRTACDAVLPTALDTIGFELSEGFLTGSGSLSGENCWRAGNTTSTNGTYIPYVYAGSSDAHTGSNYLRLYAYKTNSTDARCAYAIFPQFDVTTTGINQYQLTFWAKNYGETGTNSYNDTLWIGVLTDPDDFSTITYVSYALVSNTKYQEYTVYLDSYQGNGAYVALVASVDTNATQTTKYAYFLVDDVTFSLAPSCHPVKNVYATDITRTSMRANWEVYPNVTNCQGYQVLCTTNADPAAATESPVDVNSASTLHLDINNLDRDVVYNIFVRAICGTGNYSEWASASAKTNSLTECIAINAAEGTTSNGYVPIYGDYADTPQKTQSIYPASMLTELVGKTISKLKYYVASGGSNTMFGSWENNTFVVKMTTVEATTLTDTLSTISATTVYADRLTATVEDGMVIDLTTPFVYTGGNLLIEFELPVGGSGYSACNFQGATVTSASILSTSAPLSGVKDFLPEVDFIYCETVEACPSATNVAVSNISSTTANLSWTASAGDYANTYDVLVSDTAVVDFTSVVPQYTNLDTCGQTLTSLRDDTDYYVYVRVLCNLRGHDDADAWSEAVQFRTIITCSAPTAAVATSDAYNSITFNATAGEIGTEGTYDYRYWVVGTTDTIAIAGQPSSCTVNNLTEDLDYAWMVRANCSGTDEGSSRWVEGNTLQVLKRPTYAISYSAAPETLGSVQIAYSETDTLSDGIFYEGAQPVFTAIAEPGMMFVNWTNAATGEALSTTNPWTITVSSDSSIVANFDTASFNLNVVVAEGYEAFGEVAGSGSYRYGSTQSYSATPADHYHVVWSDDNTDSLRTIVMPAYDTTIVARFEIDQHIVTVEITGEGSVEGEGTYNYGDTVTLVATPADHYRFTQWLMGDSVCASDTLVFVVTGDITISATFTYFTSVEQIEVDNFIAYSENMNIVVKGADSHDVNVYDMSGRLVKAITKASDVELISVHASGVYVICIDNRRTLRVIVK